MTVQALGDPCMLVKEDSVFLLAEKKTVTAGRGRWIKMFFLRRLNPFTGRIANASARMYKDWRSKFPRLKNVKDIFVTQVEPIQSKEEEGPAAL